MLSKCTLALMAKGQALSGLIEISPMPCTMTTYQTWHPIAFLNVNTSLGMLTLYTWMSSAEDRFKQFLKFNFSPLIWKSMPNWVKTSIHKPSIGPAVLKTPPDISTDNKPGLVTFLHLCTAPVKSTNNSTVSGVFLCCWFQAGFLI